MIGIQLFTFERFLSTSAYTLVVCTAAYYGVLYVGGSAPCPDCNGPMDPGVEVIAPEDNPSGKPMQSAILKCRRCGTVVQDPLSMIFQPDVAEDGDLWHSRLIPASDA